MVMSFVGHPYRSRRSPVEQPFVEDWHAALRGPNVRHSLWMGLATLICTFGYPGIALLLSYPTGRMVHEAFAFGGTVVTAYFLFAALVTWAHRFRFGASAIRKGWHARQDSN